MRLLMVLHLFGVVVWIGGMFFAHVCLRPVATAQLAPPQRLPLLAAVLDRFFKIVALAILMIVASGFLRFSQLQGVPIPWNWHAMAGLGTLMVLIYLVIVGHCYPRLKTAVAAGNWPAGGAAMNRIRQLVLANLVLGTVTIVVALWRAGP